MKGAVDVALYMVGAFAFIAGGGSAVADGFTLWPSIAWILLGSIVIGEWGKRHRLDLDALYSANDEFMWLCIRCEMGKARNPERYYAGYSRLADVVEREARKHVDAYGHRVAVFTRHHRKTIEPAVLS